VAGGDCETILEFVIEQSESINLSISGYGSCGDFGYAVPSISGGQEPFEYQWDNGANTELIAQLPNGIYSLTVTDANGCTQTQETEINNFEEVLFEIRISEPTCFGTEDAFIAIDIIQGIPPFEYEWSNGASSPELIDIGGGDYTVFVTDANGCTTAANVDILEPTEIDVQANTIGAQDGSNSGSIDLFPFGGTAPYTFLWENGSTSSMRSGLANGTYFVTITDDNGCQTEKEILLEFTVGISDLLLDELNLTPNPTNGILFIDALHHNEKALDLEIYNSLGQIIYAAQHLGQIISLEVDLSAFSSGIYFVRFKSDTSTSLAKPIVKLK